VPSFFLGVQVVSTISFVYGFGEFSLLFQISNAKALTGINGASLLARIYLSFKVFSCALLNLKPGFITLSSSKFLYLSITWFSCTLVLTFM
jgi:hypothetical protein